jgi:hypothetical protein
MTISVPPGFDFYPDRPEATLVGVGTAAAADSSYGSDTFTLLQGQLVAERLDAAAESDAQSCSPGKHVAIWNLELSLLGQLLELPVYVSEAGDGLKLDLCAPSFALRLQASHGGPDRTSDGRGQGTRGRPGVFPQPRPRGDPRRHRVSRRLRRLDPHRPVGNVHVPEANRSDDGIFCVRRQHHEGL